MYNFYKNELQQKKFLKEIHNDKFDNKIIFDFYTIH